jgi:hypothetical protein
MEAKLRADRNRVSESSPPRADFGEWMEYKQREWEVESRMEVNMALGQEYRAQRNALTKQRGMMGLLTRSRINKEISALERINNDFWA